MIEVHNILDIKDYIEDLTGVIFDLDDTLYSEKQYVRSGYRKIADYFKIPEMEEDMWCVFQNGGRAIDEVLVKYDLEEYKDKAIHIYRYQIPNISLYTGVRKMLEQIQKNKKLGIITDGRPEGQRAKIKALNLEADKIIITDELGGSEYRKPNPKAYKLVMEEWDMQPDQMCYIGDNISKDFIAPEQLGMRCIWFHNPEGIYYSRNNLKGLFR